MAADALDAAWATGAGADRADKLLSAAMRAAPEKITSVLGITPFNIDRPPRDVNAGAPGCSFPCGFVTGVVRAADVGSMGMAFS